MNVALISEIALLLDSAGFTIGTVAHRTVRDMIVQEAEGIAAMLAAVGVVPDEPMLVAMAARNVGGNKTALQRLTEDGVDAGIGRSLLQALEECAEDDLVRRRPE